MFDTVWSFLAGNSFDVYTAIIATLGVALWSIDRRSMKAALGAAEKHEATVLRLKRQELEAGVQQSFALLQMKCQTHRDENKNYMMMHAPKLGFGSFSTKEDADINFAIGSARSLMKTLKDIAPRQECSDIQELETYFASAIQTSIQIERLGSDLKPQRSVRH
ncbi:hypothetical protein [uncultured Tateyamaria sp.]|uniref:hypothetical protein n=1 Tax=uncultured Tateyamaria sp. TaxID=455651 RepID=UPI00260ADB08|nr:hypothetical protein [uncultured Tateyamaria sp.]